MTTGDMPQVAWVERAVQRSAAVQRSRLRVANQVRQMLDAAVTLIAAKGDEFTTQEVATEAGVALQTLYRYFPSKDDLLLAVIGTAMAEACERWRRAAADLPDPLHRLRFYITSTMQRLDGGSANTAMAKFAVSTRWRLHRHYPSQLAEAELPFVELLRESVAEAIDAGQLDPRDPQWDSWLIGELVRSVYHFYAFAGHRPDELDIVKERLWQFSLAALGGTFPRERC